MLRTRWQNVDGTIELIYEELGPPVVEILRRTFTVATNKISGSERSEYVTTPASMRETLREMNVWLGEIRHRHAPPMADAGADWRCRKVPAGSPQKVQLRFSAGTFALEVEYDAGTGQVTFSEHDAHEMEYGEFVLYVEALQNFLRRVESF